MQTAQVKRLTKTQLKKNKENHLVILIPPQGAEKTEIALNHETRAHHSCVSCGTRPRAQAILLSLGSVQISLSQHHLRYC